MNGRLKLFLAVVIILAVSVFIMTSLSKMKKDPEKADVHEKKRYVEASVVTYDTIQTQVEGTGRLESKNVVNLSTEVQGKILEGSVPLKKGQTFKKGSVLINIYDVEADLALKASKSQFLTSLASLLPDLKIDYPENYESWNHFFESIEIDKALPALPSIKSAKEKVFVSSRSILSNYYTIKSSEVKLSKYKIYAPFDGVYTTVYAEVGAIASPGVTLASIIRTDELELEVPVEVNEAKWIEKGAPVIVKSEDKSNLWNGIVSRKSNFVDAQTQSISIFVKLPVDVNNPLYHGQYLRAYFTGSNLPNVMELPRNAVVNGNEVYVIENGKLKKEGITIHKVYNHTLLFSGIKEGTQIITEPLINPVEGTEVEVLNNK